MKTAVVILNWNTVGFLREFLPGLTGSVKGLDAEVIVADNASTDGSLEALKNEFPDVRRIELDKNYGFTGGYNRALAEIDAEYFVLINSDIEVSRHWLEPLQEWMDTHPKCGACAPKLLSYQNRGSFEYAGAAGGLIDSLGYPFCRGRLLGKVEQDHGQYDAPAKVLWGSGACLMVRRSVWQLLGGLDDRFFAHMEEIDLCWRMQLEGWEVWAVPASKAWHVGGGTLPATSPFKLRLNFRNNLLMLENNMARTYILEGTGVRQALCRARILLCFRKFLNICSACVYFLQGKSEYAGAVFTAHKEYRTLRRREGIEALREYAVSHGGTGKVAGRKKGSIFFMYIRSKF